MLTALLLVATSRVDLISDLIRTSCAIKQFTANYSVTTTTEAGSEATGLRLDYVAPDKARLERTVGASTSSTWSVDGVLALQSTEGESPMHGRVDCRAIYAELAPIEALLAASFPDAVPREAPPAASFNMRWSFDQTKQQANFVVEAVLADEGVTPLGWLVQLRDKNASPTEDAGLIRFATDEGAFEVAVRKADGFLETFAGRSPKGHMQLKLDSLVTDQTIDDARFVVPSPPANSRDVSSQLRRGVNSIAEIALRRRLYATVLAQPDAAWEEQHTKLDAITRAFYARNLQQTFQPFLEDAAKKRTGIAEHFEKLVADGKTPEEMRERRAREVGFLVKRLDEFEAGLQRLGLPAGTSSSTRADRLLELEKSVALELFRSTIRAHSLRDFEEALAKWK